MGEGRCGLRGVTIQLRMSEIQSTETHLAVERRVSIVGAWHPTLAGEVGVSGAVVDRVVPARHTPDHHCDDDACS